jgi:hypothetical protein
MSGWPSGLSEAYITLLASRGGPGSLLINVKALAASLADAGATRPLIVMLSSDSAPRLRAGLQQMRQCLNVSVVEVEHIQNPFIGKHHARWEHAYTKLNAFAAPLRRAAFLDADTLVLQNVDPFLFPEPATRDGPTLAAVVDAGECGRAINVQAARSPRFNVRNYLLECVRRLQSQPPVFNSGVMSFAPSSQLFAHMLARREHTLSYDGSDQGFLNAYYNGSFTPLDRSLNEFASDMAQMRHFMGHLVPSEYLGPPAGLRGVRILHFSGQVKPIRSRNTGGSLWMPGAWEAFAKALASYDRRCGRRRDRGKVDL